MANDLTDTEVISMLSDATMTNGVIELGYSHGMREFEIRWGWDKHRVTGNTLREVVRAFADASEEEVGIDAE